MEDAQPSMEDNLARKPQTSNASPFRNYPSFSSLKPFQNSKISEIARYVENKADSKANQYI